MKKIKYKNGMLEPVAQATESDLEQAGKAMAMGMVAVPVILLH